MLRFEEIVGQRAAVDLLRKLLATDRIPQALMFHGPAAVGKATVAHTFSAALLCEGDTEDTCGECPACKLLECGNHPDLLRVGRLTRDEIRKDRSPLTTAKFDALESDLGSQILIDQIRTLSRLVGLAPRRGRRRIFIVDPAERMNREAQNGLLKTLEEPPDRTVLLLVSSRPHLLLPTVRSRCFSIGFSAMRTSELTAVLEQRGVAAEEAAARAAISGGRLGLALELDLESRHERREEVFQMLESMSAGPAAMERLPAMAAALAGKNEPTLLEGLDLLQEMLRDAARAAPTGDVSALVHADLAPRLTALGERIGAGRAADLVACVERLRNDLRFNTNRQLIAESLLAAVAGARLP